VTSLQTVAQYFDYYAKICGYVPKKTTLVVAILGLIAQKAVPLILKEHGILTTKQSIYFTIG
jgi:hypothetical protein